MKLEALYSLIKERLETNPETSYIAKLAQSNDRTIQKVGEEATEVVIAAKNSSNQKLIEESADLLFHLLIVLAKRHITLEDIQKELSNRHQERINQTEK